MFEPVHTGHLRTEPYTLQMRKGRQDVKLGWAGDGETPCTVWEGERVVLTQAGDGWASTVISRNTMKLVPFMMAEIERERGFSLPQNH